MKPSPKRFDVYLVDVKSSGRLFDTFVAFSEYSNFNKVGDFFQIFVASENTWTLILISSVLLKDVFLNCPNMYVYENSEILGIDDILKIPIWNFLLFSVISKFSLIFSSYEFR